MSIPEWANWLARDEDGTLWMYQDKPVRKSDSWDIRDVKSKPITDFKSVYSHIKWTDEKPTPVFRAENAHTSADVSKTENTTDCIRPDHYKGEIDRMTVWEKSYSEEECRGAYKAVIDRYVSRYDRKGGIEDLYKAQECLRRLIEWEESK